MMFAPTALMPVRKLFSAVAIGAALVAATGLNLGDAQAATKIQRVVSPGGIEAWLVEEHSVPLITMSFAFRGGNSQDPAGKEGVANLATALFDEGAADLDGQTFQSKEEELSLELSFSQERDSFFGQVKALSENRDASFDLVAKAVSHPLFTDEAVGRMKDQIATQLRREEQSPEAISGLAWAKIAFPGHVYGRPPNGTIATLKDLTRTDVVNYYTRVFARDGLKIGVVGDIDAKTLGPILDKIFGSLPEKQSLTPVPDVAVKSGMAQINYETPQTIIRIGMPGPKRTDPDFQATYLMNHILGGGGFSARLYREVREKRGLAYTVDTELIPRKHAGIFAGGVGTRGDKAAESLEIIKREIKRMADDGPTQQELDNAKAYVMGSYGLRFDTSDKIAGQLIAVQMDNLGIDYFDRRNAEIQAVTLDQVKAAAKKYLSGEMSVSIVGPKS